MKIVQSFWTKPVVESKNGFDRFDGGWLDKKYYYMSWALSCLKLKELYGEVELVTDKLGKDILINKLKLPYSKVVVVLDILNHYYSDLWAVGKLYTYSIQKSPFIHIDSDVYVWTDILKDMMNKTLICQNLDCNHSSYIKTINTIENEKFYIPNVIEKERSNNPDLFACNAGVLGGTDIDFFKEYAMLAFNFIDRNIDYLGKIDIASFNIIFEQYLFYCLAKEKNISVTYLFEQIEYAYAQPKSYVCFWNIPYKTSYIHVISSFKKNRFIAEEMSARFKIEYPHYYYKVINLMKNFSL